MSEAKVGFGRLDSERLREVSQMGGKAAHAGGKAHRFTSEQARAAAMRSVELRRLKAAEACKREASEVVGAIRDAIAQAGAASAK